MVKIHRRVSPGYQRTARGSAVLSTLTGKMNQLKGCRIKKIPNAINNMTNDDIINK